MAKVLCISSQTVFGPVGNSAAVPALQASGHEVLQLPTVVLSNHPGLGRPAGQSTPAALMQEMFLALTAISAFSGLAAVMTGYFANAAQVVAAAEQIAVLKARHEQLHVVVDPVIGDHGALYVAEDVATSIRDALLPLATVTTPNLFELHWLSGQRDIARAVAKLAVAETIVTSVPDGKTTLETRLHVAGLSHVHATERREGVPHGTGDFLAGAYLAERLSHGPAPAFTRAMARLDQVIAASTGQQALNPLPLRH
jgi:pyridoxine kinase